MQSDPVLTHFESVRVVTSPKRTPRHTVNIDEVVDTSASGSGPAQPGAVDATPPPYAAAAAPAHDGLGALVEAASLIGADLDEGDA
jgi:hypothetical protein